jgi:hypothetical protein
MILHSLQNMVVRFSCFLAYFLLTLWFEAIWLLCWDMRLWAREWNNTTLHLGHKPAQWWSNVACWSCLISLKLFFLSMVAVCLSTVGSQSVQLTWWVPPSFPFLVLLALMGFALCTFSLFSYLCLCRSKDWTTNILHHSTATSYPFWQPEPAKEVSTWYTTREHILSEWVDFVLTLRTHLGGRMYTQKCIPK